MRGTGGDGTLAGAATLKGGATTLDASRGARQASRPAGRSRPATLGGIIHATVTTSNALEPTMPIEADALRLFVYDTLLETGAMPGIAAIASRFHVSPGDARRALGEARFGKGLLPHPVTGEPWMAGPFSAAPTSYRVVGPSVAWWANCAWDMLGIPVIARVPVDVEATCTDCGAAMRVRVDPTSGPDDRTDGIVHFLVPARRWYEDIAFT